VEVAVLTGFVIVVHRCAPQLLFHCYYYSKERMTWEGLLLKIDKKNPARKWRFVAGLTTGEREQLLFVRRNKQ